LRFGAVLEIDWQLIGVTFATVFIAEIGDKSQLAAIAIGGSSNHPKAVFFGSVAALLLASAIGVLAGGSITVLFPPKILKGLAALGFLIMAGRLLWSNFSPEATSTTVIAEGASGAIEE
jgi:putative Ca2+/H+ antiporter (TMEM165/GDT1 family)